ncbi:hypothetical protein BB560_006596, partial [Smittium megazygosporum]
EFILMTHPQRRSLMLRKLIELKNKALSQLESWTSNITLSISEIQNLEFWRYKLMGWDDRRTSKNISTIISSTEIVNFLAELYSLDRFKLSTLKAYTSVILLLSENTEKIGENNVFIQFFRALGYSTIKSFVQPKLDISPIIKKFKYWDPNSNISHRDQTEKL